MNTELQAATADGQAIPLSYHTQPKFWSRPTLYWIKSFFVRPKLTEANLCTIEELLGDKFVDENGDSPKSK